MIGLDLFLTHIKKSGFGTIRPGSSGMSDPSKTIRPENKPVKKQPPGVIGLVPNTMRKNGPPRPGLVPQSGDPQHPYRWVRPKDAQPGQAPQQQQPQAQQELSPGENEAAKELAIFVDQDAELYRQQLTPIHDNLSRKKKKGIYNPELATKLFRYLVDNGAKKYAKEHSGGVSHARQIFPGRVRNAVARQLKDTFDTEYELGNYEKSQPLQQFMKWFDKKSMEKRGK